MDKIEFVAKTEDYQGAEEIYLVYSEFDDEDEFGGFFITDRYVGLLERGETYKVTIEKIKKD